MASPQQGKEKSEARRAYRCKRALGPLSPLRCTVSVRGRLAAAMRLQSRSVHRDHSLLRRPRRPGEWASGLRLLLQAEVTTRPRTSAQDPGLWRRPGRPECHQTSAELYHPGGRRVVCARRGAAHDDGCPRLLAGPGPAPAATARGGPRGTSACAAVGLTFHLLVSIPLQMDHVAEQRAQRTRSDRPQQRS